LSACLHYVSPRTEGLFHAAIAQSGVCTAGELEPTLAEAEAAGIAIAEALGCGTGDIAACLRGKTSDELLAVTGLPMPGAQLPGGPFYQGTRLIGTLPNIDGHVIARSTAEAFASGDFAPRPIVIGTNRDEGTLFHAALLAAEVADEAEYHAALTRRFGDAADAIAARYPAGAFSSPNRALAEVTGDALFVCPARRTARAAATAGAPVYLYSFERELEQPFLPELGVFHSAEIPFLFNSDPRFPLGRVGSGQPVADALQGYWSRFAATGDPDGGDVAWPRYATGDERALVIDLATTVRSGHKAELCDFWDALSLAGS
jgi:para-nitrobenzyl esterase